MAVITTQHLTGFVVGFGVAACGFYLYKQNQSKVDEFLRKQGIELPGGAVHDYSSMSLQELVSEKERLEDLIAERELEEHEEDAPEPAAAS